jgi:threonylcarbamoyladenosine tRNA methylthiotransferase MtaB
VTSNAAPLDIISFGCRLNIAESEAIRTALNGQPRDRRLVVVNGCAVTGNAMREARAAIRRAHRANPEAHIVATGCAAQVDPNGFAAMPEVARVLGNPDKFTPDSYRFDDDSRDRIIVSDVMALTRTAPQMIPAFSTRARAFLEVQNGCDHRCTFCVIPYGRGNSRSVPVADAVAAAQQLVDAGHAELVLTGVDLTSYGHDLPGTPRLATLIEALLNAIPGLQRVRLGSIDVAEMDDALVDLLTGEPRLMPHVHLSLQHGDDLILKRMKRRHNRAQALAMIDRLRRARPDMAIGADLIAGFPTESDEAAQRNASLITDGDIQFAHIFPYSARAGTPAALMPQVARPAVKARAAILRTVGATVRTQWLGTLIGSTHPMLVERDGISGHLDNFAQTRLMTPSTPGSIQSVTITGLDERGLTAKAAS